MSMFTGFTILIIQKTCNSTRGLYHAHARAYSFARLHSFIHPFVRLFAVFGGVFISKLFLIFTISKILVNVIPEP